MDFAQFFIDLVLFFVYSFGLLLIIVYILRFWKMYVTQQHINSVSKNYIMLEIRLPREIHKSPMAFELVASAFTQTGGVSTWYARNWGGALPAMFSLEIASLEGVVHFYIRTQKKFKPLIETSIYAQYPGVEIIEAEDYTSLFRVEHTSPPDIGFFGVQYNLGKKFPVQDEEKDIHGKVVTQKKEMKADFLPIRTYIDMGLDKDPKEEYKNDPLSQIIESLGSIGKGQYAAVQILLQDTSNFNNIRFPATYINPVDHKHLTLAEVAKIRKDQLKKKKIKKGTLVTDEYGYPKYEIQKEEGKDREQMSYQNDVEKTISEMELTPEQKGEIEAINKKLSKPLLRCVMRSIYVAKDNYNGAYVNNLLSLLKPFAFPGFNSVGLSGVSDPYDYPWQDTMKRRKPWRREEFFDAFVEREGFHPHIGKRDTLDAWEDIFFFPYKGYVRRVWRMIIESIFYPFQHPDTDDVFTLNTEEIATLYHFPGITAATPTLPRIDSAKGVAPVNLPQ